MIVEKKDNQMWFNLIDQPKKLTDRSLYFSSLLQVVIICCISVESRLEDSSAKVGRTLREAETPKVGGKSEPDIASDHVSLQ